MAVTAGMIPIIWLVILAVLVVIEIITMGLTTIWFAGGALAALVVSLLGGPVWLQILLFLGVSVVLLIFTRPLAVRYMNKNQQKTNVDSIPGKTGEGQVMVDGTVWSARSQNGDTIEEGKVVKVLAVEGVKLIVEVEK